MARRILPWLGIAVLVIGYPLLAHYTNESAHSGNMGALVAVAPLVLIALALAWRSPRRFIMLGVLVLLCIALWAGWSALENHFGLVYWLQHVGMLLIPVSYTHLRAHETRHDLVCRLLLEKKNDNDQIIDR